MADYKVEGPELKKLMALAKRQELPFAFNPGKTDEEHYLGMHRKHDKKKIMTSTKKEGPGKKVAYGTCTVEGSTLLLKCDLPLPGMAKKLKRVLKNAKVSLAVKVATMDGRVVEDDGEPVPEGGEVEDVGQGGAPEGGQAPSKEEATQRLTEIQEQLKALSGAAAATLLADVQTVLSTAAYQSDEALQEALERVEDALADAEAEAEAEGDQEEQTREALKARVDTLVAALTAVGGPAAERLLKQANYIGEKLDTAPLDGLEEALRKVEAAARDVVPEDALTQEAPADAPAEATPGQRRSKEEMTTDLTTLQSRLAAMDGAAAQKLKSEVESFLSTAAYQGEEAIEDALKRFEEAAQTAEQESQNLQEAAGNAAEALSRRLQQVRDGIAGLTGPAVARLTRQADYLAERIGQNALDGLENAMDGLEQALRDALPEGAQTPSAPAQDAPAAPATGEEDSGGDPVLEDFKKRLERVQAGIALLTGQAVSRLTRQAEYLAERLDKNFLDGVDGAMEALEKALQDALPEGTEIPDAPGAAPTEPAEAREEDDERVRLMDVLQQRLEQARTQIAEAGGERAQELMADAEALATNLANNVLDGVERGVDALENALRTLAPDPQDELKRLATRLREIATQITELPAEVQSKVKAAFDAVVAKARAKDLPGTQEGLAKIEAVLARFGVTAGEAAPDPRLDKVLTALNSLRDRIAGLPGSPEVQAFLQQLQEAETKARESAFDAAVQIARSVQEALAAFSADGAAEDAAGAAPPPGAEAIAASATQWQQTRGVLEAEIDKLRQAINAACAGDEELKEVVSNSVGLINYIRKLDSRLDGKLGEIARTDPGPDRDGLKNEAQQLVAEYKTELAKPFFDDVDTNNGFTNVAVASSARASLADIERVLAAA